MPRVKLSQPAVKIDHTVALFRECLKQNNITIEEASKRLGFARGACLSTKLRKGSGGFNMDFICSFAKVANCPHDELMDALSKDLKQY